MNLYHQRVLEGRKEFLRLVQKQDRELLKIYIKASKKVSYRLSKANAGSLTARYLSELDRALNQYVAELTAELSKSTKAGIKASAEISSAVQLSYFDMIAPSLDVKSTFNKMFTQLPSNITKQLISGNYYSDGKTLDKRLWNITKKNAEDIGTLIKVNVAKGVNARELSRELDVYINPLNRLTPKTLQAGMSRKISYQAQRLSRTCLTHASTESYIQGSKMNPFCRGLKWNLSPSHITRMHGKTDICDEHAEKVFKPNEYPVAHPNCLCYPTQKNVDIDKARDELIAWVNGESNPKLDKWIEDYGEEFGIEKNEKKQTTKTIKNINIKTLSDAKKALIDDIGFIEIEDSLIENVDPQLIIRNTNQLKKLEDKFGIIHKSKSTISSTSKGDAIAYVSNSATKPTNQNLSLCPNEYKDRKKLIEYEKKATELGNVMPKALTDEELSISSVTHEYGHMIQNRLIQDEMEARGWNSTKPNEFLDLKKKNQKAIFKWYNNIEVEVKKRGYDEIVAIAIKNNSKFDFDSNISRYGKSSYEEFFAETFMNSQLSKPNELGKAMIEWLKEKGLGI